MASFFGSNYPFSPGQNAAGADLHTAPAAFIGQIQKQGGQRSFPPSVTAPGTVASGGIVYNTTGYDCLVYPSATTGVGAIKVLNYNGANVSTISPVGSLAANTTAAVLVPGPGAIAATYTGVLSWVWQPL